MKKIMKFAMLLSWSMLQTNALFVGDHSHTFISRVAFQRLCAFVYDPYHTVETSPTVYTPGGVTFDPSNVKEGDLIFVRQVDEYFNEIHPRIMVPYMIMTHGDCRDEFKQQYLKYLKDEKIIAWFAAHCLYGNIPKLYQLPLGVVQHKYYYDDREKIDTLFTQARVMSYKLTDELVYINYIFAHPDRRTAFEYFLDKPFVTYGAKKPFEEFIIEMAQHAFTLSPRGAGPDSYRTWEALLVGSIPIVQDSGLNPLYEGLPVVIIKDWAEVTPGFLNMKYKEICSRSYAIDKLYIEYWKEFIEGIRKRYFELVNMNSQK